ncbi:uncharacterized protein LOC134254255 [Saccostrea cucullata]|uniref:uncharacterized protein LOC134254255 n=1 Tax=Saccostrea cuccullata TaxID=36930 RepID=UPI002ED3EB75
MCFCDASTKAYACAVYLHQSNKERSTVNLLFSKTRLVPLKKLTLPRLELLAVVIGVRCINFVEKQLKLPVTEKILWTDSQCVLHWIRMKKPLKTFVENRVKEIRNNKDITFQYVSTKDNPADIASRGTTVKSLQEFEQWWNGPEWLLKGKDNWPSWNSQQTCKEMQSVIESECKSPKIVYEAKLVAGESPNGRKNNSDSDSTGYPDIIDYQKFSSFINLIPVLAWTLRFIKRVRKIPMPWTHLTYSELQNAKILVIRNIPVQHYGDIKSALKEKKRNNLISQLGLVLDEEGIIRCVGRLKNVQLSEGARTPILLPRKNHVTGLIIDYIHKKSFHVGVSQTLSLVRQDYWIPQGRAEVKRILHKCTICKRFDGGPYKMPLMPPLPKKRVSESAPFTYTGVDYFGPIFIKTDTGSKKVWVCLFTCLVVRAIHLELMQDMSTEQFLLGLRRFIARWGKPKQIISDNSAQFKLASLVLDKSWERVTSDSDVQSYIAYEEIQWQFIVELAPWMGGFYERLVGVVKRCLRKTIGKLCLTNEQMRTMLAEAEAVVNSRPLVYIGDDINSNITLTPAHFLTLNPKIGLQDSEHFDLMDPDYVPVHLSRN